MGQQSSSSAIDMATKSNPYCATCPKAHNSINGRYCNVLRRYVEYAKEPACNK